MKAWFLEWRVVAGVVLAVACNGVGAGADGGTQGLRLPADVTYAHADGSPGPVVFSHTTHVPLCGNRCVACHPQAFSILQPTHNISHEQMNAGKQCGTCHDGTQASGVQDACDHCHRMGGGP